jgi:sec-independent protein translocase protein TatC
MLNISTHWYKLILITRYFIVSLFFSGTCFYTNGDIILYFLAKPFLMQNFSKVFIFTNLLEGFLTFIFISSIISIIITLPFFTYLVFDFHKNGLFKKEKMIFLFVIKNSVILFVVSFFISYFFLFPGATRFLVSFEQINKNFLFQLHLQPKIFDYVVLNVYFLMCLLLLFHIPIIISLLILSNFMLVSNLYKNRRLLILLCFTLGCLFSPPDIFSQIFVAMPMWLCIEVIICYYFILKNYKN